MKSYSILLVCVLLSAMTIQAHDIAENHEHSEQSLKDSDQKDPASKAAVDLIYDRLNELFGNKAQLFVMEFPGRVLNQASYFYNVTDSTSQYLKPVQVAESEFRLSDNLFSVAQIVGGPSGAQLSTTWQQALNEIMPIWQQGQYKIDSEKTRQWLLSPIAAPSGLKELRTELSDICDKLTEDFDGLFSVYAESNSELTTLIDFHTRLQTRYDDMKLSWDLCKSEQMQRAIKSPEYRDEFFRWVSVVGQSSSDKIDAYWEDLVVRGYHHDVMEALGFIDRTSIGEMIEQTRNKLRDSGWLSIDGSTTVYPVQFQPDNWANSLGTTFTAQDLLMNRESVIAQISQIQDDINLLSTQKLLLQEAKQGDVATLEAEVAKQQQLVAQIQTQLIQTYGSAIATAVDMYLSSKYGTSSVVPIGDADKVSEDINNDLKKKGKAPISKDQINEILKLWNNVADINKQLTLKNQALTQLQAALAAAHSTDFKTAIAILETQIASQSNKLNSLKNLISMAGNSEDGDKDSLLPSTPPESPWQQVIFNFHQSQIQKSSKLEKSSSSSSWDVDLIFASASRSSSSSSSSDTEEFRASNVDMGIGFEATKVTIDRGGWFSPQFFKQSKGFMRVQKSEPISAGPPPDVNSLTADQIRSYSSQLFPAYPVSFIIVRDITIRITTSSEVSKATNDYLSSASSSSGGFLCFSYASASSSSSESNSFFSSSSGKTISIRIPGPQILGWYLEFVPKDESVEYKDMPNNYWPQIHLPAHQVNKLSQENAYCEDWTGTTPGMSDSYYKILVDNPKLKTESNHLKKSNGIFWSSLGSKVIHLTYDMPPDSIYDYVKFHFTCKTQGGYIGIGISSPKKQKKEVNDWVAKCCVSKHIEDFLLVDYVFDSWASV